MLLIGYRSYRYLITLDKIKQDFFQDVARPVGWGWTVEYTYCIVAEG